MTAYTFVALSCLALLPSTCSHRPPAAFVGRILSLNSRQHTNVLPAAKDTNDAMFDAEEAAAVDAHDVSDPGIEGAAMERAVMMAADLDAEIHAQIRNEREESKRTMREAEANFARGLSDAAAINHANQISEEGRVLPKMKKSEKRLLEAEDAAALDAHDVSDPGVEGAAMERAVMLAADLEAEMHEQIHNQRMHPKAKRSVLGKIKSLFHHEDTEDKEDESEVTEARNAEANYAQGLSDAAAMEHADEISLEVDDESMDEKTIKYVSQASSTEANYAMDLSDAAAVEHVKATKYVSESASEQAKDEDDRIPTVEEHYKSIEKDIKTIEHLIAEADKFDRGEGHSLERTFSDDDAADLALMMIEKSVVAATDKLEMCQEKAEQTEKEVKTALEEKYEAKALAESIERDRRAAEMRFLSTEHFAEEQEVAERRRDSSILHADNELLAETLKREHDAELKLERAIEEDIAAKKELEHMIDSKAILKQEFHDLEKIIHDRTLTMWEEEKAKKERVEAEGNHHFDWWHRRF